MLLLASTRELDITCTVVGKPPNITFGTTFFEPSLNVWALSDSLDYSNPKKDPGNEFPGRFCTGIGGACFYLRVPRSVFRPSMVSGLTINGSVINLRAFFNFIGSLRSIISLNLKKISTIFLKMKKVRDTFRKIFDKKSNILDENHWFCAPKYQHHWKYESEGLL